MATLTDHTNELISYFQQLEMHNNEVKRLTSLVDQKYNEIRAFLGSPVGQAIETAVETAAPQVTPVIDAVNEIVQ